LAFARTPAILPPMTPEAESRAYTLTIWAIALGILLFLEHRQPPASQGRARLGL
jgi:hypothetical protein